MVENENGTNGFLKIGNFRSPLGKNCMKLKKIECIFMFFNIVFTPY